MYEHNSELLCRLMESLGETAPEHIEYDEFGVAVMKANGGVEVYSFSITETAKATASFITDLRRAILAGASQSELLAILGPDNDTRCKYQDAIKTVSTGDDLQRVAATAAMREIEKSWPHLVQ